MGALGSRSRVGCSTDKPPTPESKKRRGAAGFMMPHCEERRDEAIQKQALRSQ
jgi:hypothetical protein